MVGCVESGGEKGEENHRRQRMAKNEMRLEVKFERSLGWLPMHLPKIAWEKCMLHLEDSGGS